jgi:acetyltransferase-like isoleucine patch superfamily enzyme
VSPAKSLARAAARLAAVPAWLGYRLFALFVDGDRAFHDASQAVSLWPGLPGDYVRREFYRMSLASCSDDCCISFGTILSKRGAVIGRRAYVGTHCNLGLVTLEDDVLLASHVDVLSGAAQHRFDRLDVPVREQGGTVSRVTIGRDAWVGERAVVMADVGAQAVVGAGSVVTKPVPPRAIAVGTPARVVGTRGDAGAPAAGAP